MSRQRERVAEAAVRAAEKGLTDAVDAVLRDARSGRLLTLATPSFIGLAGARAVLDESRAALRDAMVEPAAEPPPLHAFVPDANGWCSTCGKGWAGGHPAQVAPPLDMGPLPGYPPT